MKGFFSWSALSLLIASTGLNYWMVSDQTNRSSSNSSVIRAPSGAGWHK